MSQNKILLGTLNDSLSSFGSEKIYLERHKLDCGWYWGFGYVGNRNCHFHIDSLIKNGGHLASELFKKTNISDEHWWVIRDLFIQAYALKKAAEVYRYGASQTTKQGITDIIKDIDMVARLNADLKIVLDKVWDYTCAAV